MQTQHPCNESHDFCIIREGFYLNNFDEKRFW